MAAEASTPEPRGVTTSPPRRFRYRPATGVIALVAVVAILVSGSRATRVAAQNRDQALAKELRERGLGVDVEGIAWLEQPPYALHRAVAGAVPVVVRATPGPEEPHDIYLVFARLTREGVLLSVGGAYNLSQTSAVDELRPVGRGSRFAFAAQSAFEEAPSVVHQFDLAGSRAAPEGWTRLQRVQAAVSRLQRTGRLDGLQQVRYRIEPAPAKLDIDFRDDDLEIVADGQIARLASSGAQPLPSWLSDEKIVEARPGKLVNWAVDRVRAEIGDEAMQYVKAVAFTAKDFVESNQESVTGDTGAEEILADLGDESLAPPERDIPVDPDIGFPPAPLVPFVSPVLDGEGEWRAKEHDPFIHQLPGLPPTFVTTFIRGDVRRKATRVYVALWDPRLVQLNMMPGTAEPKSATGATGPGLIPREPKVLKKVAAAMNAGFQALHGEYGMMGDGVVYLPPKPYAATVAVVADGSTAFGTWPNDPTIPSDVVSFRQNMTVMVENEKFNPYGRNWWGGTPPGWEDKTHTVRTGICQTKEGFVAYFYGADQSPAALAQTMIQTRCVYGVALDMNAGHSGLEFYRVAPKDTLEPLDRPLRFNLERTGPVAGIEGWEFRARRFIVGMGLMNFPRYIEREARDFFYLTLRDVLPGEPLPLKGEKKDGDGVWKVKGLPQHGFPYALATTHATLPSGARATVLKIDPRMLTIDPKAAKEGGAAVVAAMSPPEPAAGELSVWFTADAFSIASEPLVTPAARIASGAPPSGPLAAALGVQDEEGMLVYVEVEGDAPAPGGELLGVLTGLGCSQAIGLARRLPLALGGDTNLQEQAVRLPESGSRTTLLRKPGPGTQRIFPDTPIVPLKEWHPLQAQRIRYFKKKKDTDT